MPRMILALAFPALLSLAACDGAPAPGATPQPAAMTPPRDGPRVAPAAYNPLDTGAQQQVTGGGGSY